MLVERLGSRLLGEIQQSHKFSVVEGREIETREKMRIFQAFRIQKGVSCGYLQSVLCITIYTWMNSSFLFILLQMTGNEQARLIEQAIAPFFQVTDLLMFSRNAGFRAEMREKQMAYGILLDSCGLLEMTEDAIATKVEVIKCSLHKSSKVRNCSSLNFRSTTYF